MKPYLALRLTEPQVGVAPVWELIFDRMTVGRIASRTIQLLSGKVSRLQAVISRDAVTGETHIEDDRSASGCYLNGRRFSGPTPLNDGDSLALGGILVKVFRAPEFTPERLAEAERARHSPEVFADWLESVGRDTEANWLRARAKGEHSLEQQLAARLSTNERAALASAPLRQCAKTTCPGNWSRLEPTPQPRVRTCTECRASVPYCGREAEVEAAGLKPFALE